VKSPLLYVASSAAFLGAFFGRRDPVAQANEAGLTRLRGWDRIPESRALAAAAEKPAARASRCLLYCYEGPHAGENFPVRAPRTKVGVSASDDIVLTPGRDATPTSFEFILDAGIELIGVAPNPFELNGKAEYRAMLVDYDEIALLGNRFLVLEINGGQP
jgi:hypothetical protein